MGLFDRFRKDTNGADPQQTGAFYLDADNAKTFGNIDYMRSAKTVKRTFARKKGVTEEMASVKRISSMASVSMDDNGQEFISPLTAEVLAQNNEQAANNGTVNGAAPKLERRRPDSDMDTFRNMARGMKR